MKSEKTSLTFILTALLLISVILNLIFFVHTKQISKTESSDDVSQLEATIEGQKVKIESLELALEQAESVTEDEVTTSADTIISGNDDNSTGGIEPSNTTGSESISADTYKSVAEAFLDGLLTYDSSDMDDRKSRLEAVISGSEITSKLITSDEEEDETSGNVSWQSDYSSELNDSTIYFSEGETTKEIKVLADVTYTLTDELGDMTVSGYVSIVLTQNTSGDYKVTEYQIMSKG